MKCHYCHDAIFKGEGCSFEHPIAGKIWFHTNCRKEYFLRGEKDRGVNVWAFVLFLACVIIGFVLGSSAYAHHSPKHEAVHYKMEKWSHWIADNTTYDYYRPPPVVFVSQEELNYIYIENSGNSYAGQNAGVLAAYSEGVMFLLDDFDPIRDDANIVHELVHHAQYKSGKEFACNAHAEREAYGVQLKWHLDIGDMRGAPNALIIGLQTCIGW